MCHVPKDRDQTADRTGHPQTQADQRPDVGRSGVANGISASHLSRLERGQTLPSFTVLAQIAHVLRVSVDRFVNWNLMSPRSTLSSTTHSHSSGFRKRPSASCWRIDRTPPRADERHSRYPSRRQRTARHRTPRCGRSPSTDSSGVGGLNRVIKTTGFSGVSFTRIVWTLDAGRAALSCRVPGLIGHLGDNVVRTTGADQQQPVDPQVSAAWKPDDGVARYHKRMIVGAICSRSF
jgi:transcriptional regulator with XRE-family HTH domain